MEKEILIVKFIEISGADKDLGGCEYWEGSDGKKKMTEKLQDHGVRFVIHNANGITKITEIGKKKTEPKAKVFKPWAEGSSGR